MKEENKTKQLFSVSLRDNPCKGQRIRTQKRVINRQSIQKTGEQPEHAEKHQK
jgi:hypothetical protein